MKIYHDGISRTCYEIEYRIMSNTEWFNCWLMQKLRTLEDEKNLYSNLACDVGAMWVPPEKGLEVSQDLQANRDFVESAFGKLFDAQWPRFLTERAKEAGDRWFLAAADNWFTFYSRASVLEKLAGKGPTDLYTTLQ